MVKTMVQDNGTMVQDFKSPPSLGLNGIEAAVNQMIIRKALRMSSPCPFP